MPTNRLTELAIRNAKCGSKRKKLSDGGSMYLELHPNGGKYWRMNYQFQKKEKTLALGVWPQTSLVEARHKRDEAKMLLKSGKDPISLPRAWDLYLKTRRFQLVSNVLQLHGRNY